MNFSLILMLLTVGTGIIWCLDRFLCRPKRLLRAKEEADRFSELNRQAIDQGEMSVIGEAHSVCFPFALFPCRALPYSFRIDAADFARRGLYSR